jgi:hypothetical protein
MRSYSQLTGSIRFVYGGPKSFLMKIHADVIRIPATRKRVSSRDVFWTSRKANIGTAVRYPSQYVYSP